MASLLKPRLGAGTTKAWETLAERTNKAELNFMFSDYCVSHFTCQKQDSTVIVFILLDEAKEGSRVLIKDRKDGSSARDFYI
jgi:hypothetical protein